MIRQKVKTPNSRDVDSVESISHELQDRWDSDWLSNIPFINTQAILYNLSYYNVYYFSDFPVNIWVEFLMVYAFYGQRFRN